MALESPRARWARRAEYVAAFFGVPTAFALGWVPVPLIPALWIVSGVCLAALLADPGFDRSELWNARDLRGRLARAAVPFAVAAPLLGLATLAFDDARLFSFLRARPWLWLAVMVLYPVLSAYPQGIVFRVFVFHRYGPVFRGRGTIVFASAIAFSFVHVVFGNWVAPLLSLAGGLLFAWTYERTRSSLVATFQHALFGCWVFTVGLGTYFYYGAAR